MTPQAPLTGSGWREHSYGGFWGGQPHFHPHAFRRQLDLHKLRYQFGSVAQEMWSSRRIAEYRRVVKMSNSYSGGDAGA